MKAIVVDGCAAATAVGVTPATIRKWKQRKRIQPVGRDRRGRDEYRLDDVIAAARR